MSSGEGIRVAESFAAPHVPVDLNPDGRLLKRADIVFEGVDMSGPSFEARVFLNNPSAAVTTPLEPEQGYAGSFHVYGLGVSKKSPQSHPVTRTLTATDAVRKAAQGRKEVSVTVVPVYYGAPATSAGQVFKVEKVFIRTS